MLFYKTSVVILNKKSNELRASLNVSTTGKCQVEDIHLNVSLYNLRLTQKQQISMQEEDNNKPFGI